MEIRNVLERLKLLTNDDREDLLLMLSGDAVQRLKARLCCTCLLYTSDAADD